MKYKIENVYEDDELDSKYINALNEKGLNVGKQGHIEINSIDKLNQVIEVLENTNSFESNLGYNGVILHGNTITIHDSFIY